jgi:hypothetical protein
MAAALSKSRDPGMVKTASSGTQTLSEFGDFDLLHYVSIILLLV